MGGMTQPSRAVIIQRASATIPAASGNTVIPLDSTPPLVGEGTQIISLAYTPMLPTSKAVISGCFTARPETPRSLTVAVFRDAVCIGAAVISASDTVALAAAACFSFEDTSGLAGTYSVRVGHNTGTASTWYINQVGVNTLGGEPAKSIFSIEEIKQ